MPIFAFRLPSWVMNNASPTHLVQASLADNVLFSTLQNFLIPTFRFSGIATSNIFIRKGKIVHNVPFSVKGGLKARF